MYLTHCGVFLLEMACGRSLGYPQAGPGNGVKPSSSYLPMLLNDCTPFLIPKMRLEKCSRCCMSFFCLGSLWGQHLGMQHAPNLLTHSKARSSDVSARPLQFRSSLRLCFLTSSWSLTSSQEASEAPGESWGSGHLCPRHITSPPEVIRPTAFMQYLRLYCRPGMQIHFFLLSSAGVRVKGGRSLLVLLPEGSTSQAGAGCCHSCSTQARIPAASGRAKVSWSYREEEHMGL